MNLISYINMILIINKVKMQEDKIKGMTLIKEGFYMDENHRLGGGAFGQVFLGYSTKLQKKLAVKQVIIPHNEPLDTRQIETLKILSSLVHPNIMGFYDFELTQDFLYMFIEFCPGVLTNQIQKGLTEDQILTYLKQILLGMGYMNAKNQMHRDLKPDNIIIGEDKKLKICDFGLARSTSKDLEKTSDKGTPLYTAPQVWKQEDAKYTEKCDVWNVGHIIYEMFNKKPPFDTIKKYPDLFAQWERFERGKMLKYSDDIHPFWEYFTNMMLTYNPIKRPNFATILTKFKKIEPFMRKHIQQKQKNPKLTYFQIVGDNKYKKVQQYLRFYQQKSQVLLCVTRFLQQYEFPYIRDSIKELLKFVTIQRYLCRVSEMAKQLKYKSLQLPSGQDIQEEGVQIPVLFEKYATIYDNIFLFNNHRVKQEILPKVLDEYKSQAAEKPFYQDPLIAKIVQMCSDARENMTDVQQQYSNTYRGLINHKFVKQQDLSKMKANELRCYLSIIIADKIDSLFPDKSYDKSNEVNQIDEKIGAILGQQNVDKLRKYIAQHESMK